MDFFRSFPRSCFVCRRNHNGGALNLTGSEEKEERERQNKDVKKNKEQNGQRERE